MTPTGISGPRPWLRAITRVTEAAAAGAAAWARRLEAHPAIGGALAAGQISASWARDLCTWTDQIPGDRRSGAGQILLAAACGGAGLRDLAALRHLISGRNLGGKGVSSAAIRPGHPCPSPRNSDVPRRDENFHPDINIR